MIIIFKFNKKYNEAIKILNKHIKFERETSNSFIKSLSDVKHLSEEEKYLEYARESYIRALALQDLKNEFDSKISSNHKVLFFDWQKYNEAKNILIDRMRREDKFCKEYMNKSVETVESSKEKKKYNEYAHESHIRYLALESLKKEFDYRIMNLKW